MVQCIGPPVGVPALNGVLVVRPPALDVHEVEEPGAVGVLVEHAEAEGVAGDGGAGVSVMI
jgi:hypothetical protein